MADTGTVHIPQPIPDVNQLSPGQRASTPTFFLRATPPIFRALVVGGNNSNVDLGLTRGAMIPVLPMPPRMFTRSIAVVPFALATANPASLVRTRALGSPAVNPKIPVSAITRSRALGTITVVAGGVQMTSLVRTRGLGTLAIAGSLQPEPYRNWHRSLRGVKQMDDLD